MERPCLVYDCPHCGGVLRSPYIILTGYFDRECSRCGRITYPPRPEKAIPAPRWSPPGYMLVALLIAIAAFLLVVMVKSDAGVIVAASAGLASFLGAELVAIRLWFKNEGSKEEQTTAEK